MVISNTSFAHISFMEAEQVLSICWKTKPDIGQFKNLYWQALQYVKTRPSIRFYLTDISAIGAFDMDQEVWLSQEYYPQVSQHIQADIYAAVVFSERHFKALVSNYVAAHLNPLSDFIQFNYFTDSEEALDWLRYMQQGQDLALVAKS